jgi:hypothetical protein
VLLLKNCAFGLHPSSGVSKIEELKIYTKYHNKHFQKFAQGSITHSYSLIVTWVFPWLLVFQGVCGCACAFGLYAILVFPRFSLAVKCAVAVSLIAIGF